MDCSNRIILILILLCITACGGGVDPNNKNNNNTEFQVRDYEGDVNKGFEYWTQAHCHECHGTSISQGLNPIDPKNLKKTNLDELVNYIETTMPNAYGADKCDAECAKHTAQFIMGWVDGSAKTQTPAGEVGGTLTCSDSSPIVQPELVRLSPAEFANSAKDLLKLSSKPDVSSLASDELGDGFLYSASVVVEYTQAYADVAEAAAAEFMGRYEAVSGCSLAGNNAASCANGFVTSLAERAFKIPPGGDLAQSIKLAFEDELNASDVATAVNASVELILQSPFFLYRSAGPIASSVAGQAADQYINASRLSYLLTGSLPDEQLWLDAQAGALSKARLLEHAERILKNDSAREHLTREFVGRWFKVKNVSPTRKDISLSERQKLVDDALVFIEKTAWGDGGGLVNMMTRKAKGDASTGLLREDPERFGLLTQPAWMVNFGLAERTNPIMRGVFFAENMLCRVVPNFEGDVDFPEFQAGLSLRDQLEEHRTNPVCASCHALFDPMGLAFEKYDNYGNTRVMDEGKIIDASGVFLSDGEKMPFNDAPELMNFVANSEELRYCAMKNWMAYAYRNEIHEELSCEEKKLSESLALDSGLETMVLDMLTKTAFFR